MNNIRAHHFDDKAALAAQLAGDIVRMLEKAIATKGSATLAVSGGSTPRLLFQQLSQKALEWDKVTVLLVDERFVPPTDERSNEKLLRENFHQNAASNAKIFGFWLGAQDIITTRNQLNEKVDAFGELDVVILGMGTDGHTASFFPGGNHLDKALNPSCELSILDMEADGAGEPRLTLTLPKVIGADNLVLHIEGDVKMNVLKDAMQADAPETNSSRQDKGLLPIRVVIDASPCPIALYWAP